MQSLCVSVFAALLSRQTASWPPEVFILKASNRCYVSVSASVRYLDDGMDLKSRVRVSDDTSPPPPSYSLEFSPKFFSFFLPSPFDLISPDHRLLRFSL